MKRIWIVLLLFVSISLFSQEEVARFTWEYRDYDNIYTYRIPTPGSEAANHVWKEFEVKFSFSSIDNFNIRECIETWSSGKLYIRPTDDGYIAKISYASDVPYEKNGWWRRLFGDHMGRYIRNRSIVINPNEEQLNPQVLVIIFENMFNEKYEGYFYTECNFDYDEQEGYWTGNVVSRTKPYKFFIEEYIIYKTNK